MDKYTNFLFEASLLFIISFVISMNITLRFFIIRKKIKYVVYAIVILLI